MYWKWFAVNNAGLNMHTGITVCGGRATGTTGPEGTLCQVAGTNIFCFMEQGKGGGGGGREKCHFDPEFIGSPKRYKELQREECDLAAFHADI